MQYFWFLIFLGLVAQQQVTSKAVGDDDDLIVQLVTPRGKIQGHTLQSDKGIDYYAFQEIPFALPPVGENRLQDPKPAEGWEGILNTTQNTKICMQALQSGTMGPPSTITLGDSIPTEDCLYLNVYTPVKPGSNSSLPVYVWIYGGGYLGGDGTFQSYNPKFLIDYDVIIVTMNYRIGAFGFLTTDDENLPANLGLKDQQFAIQWVTQNIQLFGGNPKKITVGGESAGASSVSYQLLTKKNRDLVSGFIQQSGTALGMTTYQPNFNNFAFQLGKILNSSLSSTSSKDLREVLLKAPADDILTYQEHSTVVSNLTNGVMDDLLWAPIIENDNNPNAIITSNMLQDFMDGNFNRVPSIVGFNSEEALGFVSHIEEGLEVRAKKYDDDASLLVTTKINVTDREQAGLELKPIYTNSTFVEDIGGFIRFSSAVGFTRPSLKQIEESSKYASVYVYEFAYSDSRSTYPGTENTQHTADVAYFWGEREGGTVNSTIRSQFLTLWSNFIKYQDPTPQIDDVIGVKWPKVDPGQDIVYLNINRTLEIRSNPKQYREVKNVLDKYITEPYVLY